MLFKEHKFAYDNLISSDSSRKKGMIYCVLNWEMSRVQLSLTLEKFNLKVKEFDNFIRMSTNILKTFDELV